MRRIFLISLLLIAATGSGSVAGIPDPINSHWSCRAGEDVIAVASPSGNGLPLDAVWPVAGGPPLDATIDVWILDQYNQPIPYYPHEDIWLEGAGLTICPGGSYASATTDLDGHTTITMLAVGGFAWGEDLQVMVNGIAIQGSAPQLRIAGVDLDGNLIVDNDDLIEWTTIFAGFYDPRIDYNANGRINLTDLVVFTKYEGDTCP